MLDGIADLDWKAIKDDLANGKEGDSKEQIAYRPSVLEGSKDEDELKDDVDDDADEAKDVHDDPEGGRFCAGKGGDALEGGYRDEKGHSKDYGAG
jgi:hypothetical protein